MYEGRTALCPPIVFFDRFEAKITDEDLVKTKFNLEVVQSLLDGATDFWFSCRRYSTTHCQYSQGFYSRVINDITRLTRHRGGRR